MQFDQPGQKKSRRVSRSKKALATGAQPLGRLRPAVRCPTQRYNIRLRGELSHNAAGLHELTTVAGRGFTLTELKEAGIRKKEAKGLGISVDHRRRSKSEEGQTINVERLKEYRSRLVVFPKKAGKPKTGDASVCSVHLKGKRGMGMGHLADARRVTTLPPTSPDPSQLFLPPTKPRSPGQSPMKRRNLRHTLLCVPLGQTRGTRGRGRRGLRRKRLRRLPSRSRQVFAEDCEAGEWAVYISVGHARYGKPTVKALNVVLLLSAHLEKQFLQYCETYTW